MASEHFTVGSNSYQIVKTFKYLSSSLTDQNSIHEEIKYILTTGNSCYYSIQTFRLLDYSRRIRKLKCTKQ